MSVEWSYFDKFEDIVNKWVPVSGEGHNAGSQAATAVLKLIYKWYNDGDVYDNQHGLTGWWNDISSYANWLDEYVDGCSSILSRIFEIGVDEDAYSEILKDLADLVLNDNFLESLANEYDNDTVDSIYDCDGQFVYFDEEDLDEDFDSYIPY